MDRHAPASVERPRRRRDPLATPRSPYADFRAQSRFTALDGLRGISILAVIWHHTAAGLGGIPLSDNGFLGVDMFFVLSGFLIVTLILRERARTGTVSLERFYVRRTLRIFPIYYLVLGGVLLFVTVVSPGSPMRVPFLAELPFHLTYTSNWIHSATLFAIAWSLATEEQFYLLWPPIERFLPRVSVALVLAFVLLNQLVNFGVFDGVLVREFGVRRDEFAILQVTFTPICLGVLLAHVLHRPTGFAFAWKLLAHAAAPWILLTVLVVECNTAGDLAGLPRLVIQLAMTLFLATCVLAEDHALSRALSARGLRRIGAISYGMYLYHPFARHFAQALLDAAGITAALALFCGCSLLTIALAELSFRWIEAPLTGWKRRFDARSAATLAAKTAHG
jgi:peptidoglycan/LPS O-acetylase OafA/YrhL